MDWILIEKLQVRAVIGVWDWERQIQQPLWFDLELGTDIRAAAASDALADALDYQRVCEQVQTLTATLQPQLIETLAEHCCAHLFATWPQVQAIRLTVRKPFAIQATASVGVRIERQRPPPQG